MEDELRLTKAEIRIYTDPEEEFLRQIEVLDDRDGPKSGLTQCKLVKSLMAS